MITFFNLVCTEKQMKLAILIDFTYKFTLFLWK